MKRAWINLVWPVLFSCLCWPVAAFSDETPSLTPDRSARVLQIAPAEIHLGGANRRQQLLVTAISDTGRPYDVTHRARLEIEDPGVAKLDGSVVDGASDGLTHLRASFGTAELRVRVIVEGYDRYPPLHFANDVIPLFSKLGCNSGGCHGKASGQNGFRLSVFGFDPPADYAALTKAGRGRRIFPADPARSLLVKKAVGEVPHGGGQRTESKSIDHELLTEWIRQGMPWGQENAATIAQVRFEPANRVMLPNANQQILVTAIFSDGSQRDVTAAATFSVNAETVARVERGGLVQIGTTPGEVAVTVNYMGHVGTVQLLVPRPSATVPYPQIAAHNEIDRLVWEKLQNLGLVPSDVCDDSTFLRRLFVDALGTLPTPDEVRSFLADTNPAKRSIIINRVLERDELVDYWTLKWADVLMVDRKALGERGAYAFHGWLREQIRLNRPYDEWVRELLCASGNSGKHGAVNFYRAARTPEDLARSVSQVFLGVRIDCAQCHHHPFDRWGQEDFFGLAGFFQGMVRTKLSDDRERVFHGGYQEIAMPLTGAAVAARPLGGEVPAGLQDGDPRTKLAAWITSPSPENPWFARLVANRLWKHYLGRGLVEPEDDLRSTNPATNESLLAYLAQQVVAHNYDLKAIMRLILNSRVYQLSSQTNATNHDDEQNFSHHLVRRMPVEVLLDAISEVTGSPESFPGLPPGTRAIQLWDNRLPSYFLDTFGRSRRESPCACGTSGEPTMSQALHLMNAPEIEEKIARRSGRVARLVDAGKTQDEIVSELCLAACGRPATERQRQVAADLFARQSPGAPAEDFLWTLLNSYDFLFVH